MTLTEFICARIDNDEAAGKAWDERGFTDAPQPTDPADRSIPNAFSPNAKPSGPS